MKNGNRGLSVPVLMKRAVFAALIFLVAVVIMAAIVSVLVNKEILSVENVGYGVLAALLVASIVSGIWSKIRYGKEWGNIIVGSAADGIALLAVGALVFGAAVLDVLPSLIVVIAGNVLPYLLVPAGKNKAKHYHIKR